MGIIQSNYSLTESNSLGVPSIAEHFIRIESLEDLESAKDFADENDLKIFPIGEGSNLVLRPIIPGLVAQIALTGIASIEESETDVLIEVYAGENWHQSVSWCLQNNYFGIESLALIPGSVGAAPVQNIGAYGAEIAEYLERLEYFDLVTGKLVELSADECGFAYRDSRFKKDLKDKVVITRIWLRLHKSSRTKSDYPSLKSYMDELGLAGSAANVFDAVCAVRRSRLPDPIIHPNVGSFFHNPVVPEQQHKDLLKIFPEMPGYPSSLGGVKIPAAWLIEFLGLKGQEISRVKISDQHALVLTNINKQDANAVLDAASKIQDLVKETFAIQLNIEPRVYPD
jgi:UDP-N-acetylmuramate dehydrogenase